MVEHENNESFEMHGWHLRKEITVGQILTMAMIIVSVLWWGATVEKRMGQLASEDVRIDQKYDLQIQSIEAQFLTYDRNLNINLQQIRNDIRSGFERIDRKLDGKVDK